MILLRNLTGINNQSAWKRNGSSVARYIFTTTGTKGRLHVAVGSSANTYSPDANTWALAAEGHHYRYFLERTMQTAWTSLPSGHYDEGATVTLRAIATDKNAQLVYTLDGTDPTSQSTRANNGATLRLPEGNTTLKVALLTGGKVLGTVTRTYQVEAFKPYDISVNVNTDAVGWTSMYVWSWGGDGSHNPTAKSWPGDRVTTTTKLDGKTWYTLHYAINAKDDYVNFVFNSSNGSVQTANVQNVKRTSYLVVTTSKDASGHYLVKDVSDTHATAIAPITTAKAHRPTTVTSIDGRTLRRFSTYVDAAEATTGLPAGLYIVNGAKVAKP